MAKYSDVLANFTFVPLVVKNTDLKHCIPLDCEPLIPQAANTVLVFIDLFIYLFILDYTWRDYTGSDLTKTSRNAAVFESLPSEGADFEGKQLVRL